MLVISDLDDCILQTSQEILRRVNQEFESEYQIEDCYSYSISQSFNLDEEIVSKCVEKALLSTKDLKNIPGAILGLNWVSSFCDLWIVSKRPDYLTQITQDALTIKGLKDFHLFLSHPVDKDYVNKIEVANDLKADVFIEDSPETVMDLYEQTDCRILIFDRPWNRGIKENSRISVVRNWLEIRDYISYYKDNLNEPS